MQNLVKKVLQASRTAGYPYSIYVPCTQAPCPLKMTINYIENLKKHIILFTPAPFEPT